MIVFHAWHACSYDRFFIQSIEPAGDRRFYESVDCRDVSPTDAAACERVYGEVRMPDCMPWHPP